MCVGMEEEVGRYMVLRESLVHRPLVKVMCADLRPVTFQMVLNIGKKAMSFS